MAPAQTSRCAIATGGTGSVKMVLTLLAELITFHVRLPKIEGPGDKLSMVAHEVLNLWPP